MEIIKSKIEEQGLLKNCDFCFDGADALSTAKMVIEDSADYNMPVCLMILDH
jgi:hypothetical protein